MFLRVISELKRWNRIENKSDALPADCFFDIRTTRNTLSLWKIDNKNEISKFAVISTIGKSSLSKITYVLLDEEELQNCGLLITQDAPGCGYLDSSRTEILSHHYDISLIDHNDYIKIANVIIDKIETKRQDIILLDEVRKTVKELCSDEIILIDKLQESMKSSILEIN